MGKRHELYGHAEVLYSEHELVASLTCVSDDDDDVMVTSSTFWIAISAYPLPLGPFIRTNSKVLLFRSKPKDITVAHFVVLFVCKYYKQW